MGMNITLMAVLMVTGATKLLVLALVLTVGVVVGMIAGWLSRLDGTKAPVAVLRGGTAFAGAVALLLSILVTFDLM
jgi:hypothetical protein